MKIIVDVMSGDNAPLELIKGAVMAKESLGIDVLVVGNESIIKKVAADEALNISNIEIANADSVVNMEDDAMSVVR